MCKHVLKISAKKLKEMCLTFNCNLRFHATNKTYSTSNNGTLAKINSVVFMIHYFIFYVGF